MTKCGDFPRQRNFTHNQAHKKDEKLPVYAMDAAKWTPVRATHQNPRNRNSHLFTAQNHLSMSHRDIIGQNQAIILFMRVKFDDGTTPHTQELMNRDFCCAEHDRYINRYGI
ncbi:hypothetical protein SAMN04488056_104376 [Cohaesibacter marisflavi]|uniref:Uncharacterized protein n=1 Tax=Cohaesibacter marisflavi TaxID=655353 RepID=A0A1I5G6A8_9HYPH|nr:hypothetical protein SAMN04488056_104376 [Cohaesibacter marisflavi]